MPSIRGGMERPRSTTSQSPVRTSFTGIYMSCGMARSSTQPDYFTNAAGNHKPRSTVNHFGGSVGGPIVHDKLFFFFDSEWVRIALPIVTAITVPTPAFQNYVLQQLPMGWNRSDHRVESISLHRSRCRFIDRCFRFTEIPAARLSRCSAALRCGWRCARRCQ